MAIQYKLNIFTGTFDLVDVTSGTIPNFADNETPTGSINGSNTVFTLANAPNPTDSLILVLNGQQQLEGTDYTLSGVMITFISIVPEVGMWLRAWYRY